MILENHGQQNKKQSAMFEKITGNVFLNHRQCFVKRWATFFQCARSFKSASTAAFNCVSSPLTTVSGALATFTSGSNCVFSR